jgi:hypothetical protein
MARNWVRIGENGSLRVAQSSTWSPYFQATYAANFSNSAGVDGVSQPAAGAGSPSWTNGRAVIGSLTHAGSVKWLTVTSGSSPCARSDAKTAR